MNKSPAFATVTMLYPDGRDEIFSISENQTLKIGREASNDISVDDSAVSRVHASITASATGLLLADHASLNGTFVNGDRVSTMRVIEPSDVVNLGPVKISVEIHGLEGLTSTEDKSRAMTAQLKPCSVNLLIASIPNYLSIAKSIPASEAANMLASWSHEVSKIIREHQGEFDQFINSSIVARWISLDDNTSADKVLAAAKAIREYTKSVAGSEWSYQQEHPWEAKLVLHAGHGLIGKVGENTSKGFTILGDPVNSAFKLAEAVQHSDHTIILSQSLADSLDDLDGTVPIEEVPGSARALED